MVQFDLNDARILVIVARAGTFSAAAKELNSPPSTVARSMTRLERHLGTLLMKRGPRGIVLTDVGAEFLLSCKQALQVLKEGSERLKERHDSPSGLIKVVAPVMTARSVLMPILPEFLRRYPDMRVDFQTYVSDWDQEPREDNDVFFKKVSPRNSSRCVRAFPSTLRGLFASNKYLKNAGSPTEPNELLSHSCIGPEPWSLSRENEVVDVSPTFRVTVADPFAIRDLVLGDFGIAVMPIVMAQQPELQTRLTRILPLWSASSIVHTAHYLGPSRFTPKIQAYLDCVAEFFGTERDPRLGKALRDDCFARAPRN